MPWGLGGKPRMRDQDFKLSFAHIRSVKTDITRRPSAVSLLRRGSTFRYRSGHCCNYSTAIVAVCAYNAPLVWLVFVVYNTVVGPSTSYCRREPACASERARDSKGLNIYTLHFTRYMTRVVLTHRLSSRNKITRKTLWTKKRQLHSNVPCFFYIVVRFLTFFYIHI